MSGVTSQGFENKQYTDIIEELVTEAKTPEYFGGQFPTTPDSVFGVLVSLFAAALKDQWDLSGAVADQGNRDKASGKYLDDLAALIGLTRLLASNGSGYLLFTGANGTVIPVNTAVKSTSNKETVITQTAVTLNILACNMLTLTIPVAVTGATYNVTVNGTTFSHTATTGQSNIVVYKILSALINDEDSDIYTSVYRDGQLVIYSLTQNNNLLVTTSSNITLNSVSALVLANAANAGEIDFYADTLTTMVSTIIGVSTVNNPEDFSAGRAEETDAELRIRMEEREQSTGTATKPAIEASVSDIEGVTFAFVIENTSLTTDASGRPPKSYELYISGGNDVDIAEVVWATKPAGIETHGTTSVVITDSNGDPQLVKFSRFDNKYAWVRLTYAINSEEDFNSDSETKLKEAVVETGEKFYRGEDLEPTKFYGNIYSNVEGVYITKIEVAITDEPYRVPYYSTTRVSVDNVTNLVFSVDRVSLLT